MNQERMMNLLLGASVLSWALLGLLEAGAEARWTTVRLAIAGLNATVGILFIVRQPLRASAPLSAILYSLPSLLIAGWALNAAPPPQQWPLHAQGMFLAGAVIAVWAFCCLGRSFAVFPALRSIVVRGPYQAVRHPAYTGEWLLAAACFAAGTDWLTFAPMVLALPLLALRIRMEERLLLQDADYARYAESVRWRMLPGVW